MQSTRKLLWFDEESGEHKDATRLKFKCEDSAKRQELHEGQSLPLALSGGAASASSSEATVVKGTRPHKLTIVVSVSRASSLG